MADYHKSRADELQSIRGWSFDAQWTENQDAHTVDVVLTFEAAAAVASRAERSTSLRYASVFVCSMSQNRVTFVTDSDLERSVGSDKPK